MSALLARRLKVAIDQGNVRVVIATSTLSEGINIPVNTLLVPSVYRANSVSVNEFSNLIGRAGWPRGHHGRHSAGRASQARICGSKKSIRAAYNRS
jgi:replicative superfamily II helicase